MANRDGARSGHDGVVCRSAHRHEVIGAFTEAEAAIGPVMDMADIAVDPHYAAREAIVELDGTPMQGLIAKLSATPGALRWQGRALDADGDEIRAKVGELMGREPGRAMSERRRTSPARCSTRASDGGSRQVEALVADAGFVTFLPHRDNPPKDEHNVAADLRERQARHRRVRRRRRQPQRGHHRRRHRVGARLRVRDAASTIIGLHTDWRTRFDHEVVNLMIECSLTGWCARSTSCPTCWPSGKAGADVEYRSPVNIRETTAADLPAALALNNAQHSRPQRARRGRDRTAARHGSRWP